MPKYFKKGKEFIKVIEEDRRTCPCKKGGHLSYRLGKIK